MRLRIPTALLLTPALALGAIGLAAAPAPGGKAAMTASEQALHVLNRLGFGPRPGDVDRVLAIGVSAYVDRQLEPAAISDDATAAALRRFPTLAMTTAELVEKFELPLREARRQRRIELAGQGGAMASGATDGADLADEIEAVRQRIPPENRPRRVLEELTAARIVRAAQSERQLNEVLVDFWMNHFNVFAGKGLDRVFTTSFERDVIRPRIWGRFEDLLIATAKSPAMLVYLDNAQSTADEAHRPGRPIPLGRALYGRGPLAMGKAGGSATVESEGSRVSAAKIELDKTRRTLDAQGNARAVFVPGKTQRAPTLVGDSSRPTYGKSARIVVDDTSRVATLSGGATLWQGASSLFGDDITLNDAERTLVAVGHTRTVIAPEPAPAETRPAADRSPTVVTARRLIYREAEGTALFEGEIAVTRGARRAAAQKATAILGKDRKIERVELTGDVSIADATAGRTGKAERAVDWPPQDRTVLEGSPAWVTDAEGNRVSGATLTITEGGRRVEVTAPDGGKTETIHKTKKQ